MDGIPALELRSWLGPKSTNSDPWRVVGPDCCKDGAELQDMAELDKFGYSGRVERLSDFTMISSVDGF